MFRRHSIRSWRLRWQIIFAQHRIFKLFQFKQRLVALPQARRLWIHRLIVFGHNKKHQCALNYFYWKFFFVLSLVALIFSTFSNKFYLMKNKLWSSFFMLLFFFLILLFYFLMNQWLSLITTNICSCFFCFVLIILSINKKRVVLSFIHLFIVDKLMFIQFFKQPKEPVINLN